MKFDLVPASDPGTFEGRQAPGRWLTLEGLRGHVEVAGDEAVLRRGWLRLARSPGLDTLDLSAHPGPLDLQVLESGLPRRILLPKAGTFLHLQIRGAALPELEIHGQVLRCLVEQSIAAADPSSHRAYLLDRSNGLVLQSTDVVRPRAGIQRHVRLDQSDRGLQQKDLRARVKPDQILWRLMESARADRCPRTQLLWMAREPGALDRKLLGADRDASELRRNLLKALLQPPPVDRPFATDRLNMGNLELLAWLARSGHDLESLWLLRCGLQHLVMGRAGDPGSLTVVNTASPCWPNRAFPRYRPQELSDADLELFALCQHLRATRACATRLGRLEYPSQVLSLAARIRHPELTPRAAARLRSRLGESIVNLRRCAVRDGSRDPQVHGDEWALVFNESSALDELAESLAVIGHEPAVDEFLALAEQAVSCNRRIAHGIVFHRHGLRQGRTLLARCLERGERISKTARRRAMECLLSPLPPRRQSDVPCQGNMRA